MKTYSAKLVDTTATQESLKENQDSMASWGHSILCDLPSLSVRFNWFPALADWFRWDFQTSPTMSNLHRSWRHMPTTAPPSPHLPSHQHCQLELMAWSQQHWWHGPSSFWPWRSPTQHSGNTQMFDRNSWCRFATDKFESAHTLQHVYRLDLIGYSINLKSVQLAGDLKIEHWENLPLLIKSYQIHIFSGVKLPWFHQSQVAQAEGHCCQLVLVAIADAQWHVLSSGSSTAASQMDFCQAWSASRMGSLSTPPSKNRGFERVKQLNVLKNLFGTCHPAIQNSFNNKGNPPLVDAFPFGWGMVDNQTIMGRTFCHPSESECHNPNLKNPWKNYIIYTNQKNNKFLQLWSFWTSIFVWRPPRSQLAHACWPAFLLRLAALNEKGVGPCGLMFVPSVYHNGITVASCFHCFRQGPSSKSDLIHSNLILFLLRISGAW